MTANSLKTYFNLVSIFRIDFNQLAKPTNLQNSAVLRMLEEEEARKKSGQSSECFIIITYINCFLISITKSPIFHVKVNSTSQSIKKKPK